MLNLHSIHVFRFTTTTGMSRSLRRGLHVSKRQAAAAAKPSRGQTYTTQNVPNIVLIDAVRTPFVQSNTVYKELMSVDLQRRALQGIVERTNVSTDDIGKIICGTVVQECRTSNIAREASITGGLPDTIPCSTVTLACISSGISVHYLANCIRDGEFECGIAGGVEFLSDYPIRYHRKVRSSLIDLQKAKTFNDKLQLGKTIVTHVFTPDLPAVTEYTTGETMGASADRLAAAFSVSRAEQDEFAIRSNKLAEKALKDGHLSDVIPMFVPKGKQSGIITTDNGIRVSTVEQLAKLRPAFIKPHGTVTAGNASFLTDGASAALISSEDYALKKGYTPKAYVRRTVFVSQDPKDQLLLSPAYVIPKLLDKEGLTLNDIDVFEIHEAFAGQVLANLNAMSSEHFCKTYLKRSGAYGRVPMEKLNLWGGSLSLGHPFGATGIRLLAHAANRLKVEGGRYAIIAACAAGGHGMGMLVEAYPN